MVLSNDPRPESLSAKDRQSFAFQTVKDRLPDILTKVIDAFSRLAGKYHAENCEDKAEDAKAIVAKYSQLKFEMQTDKVMCPLQDGHDDVIAWNEFLKEIVILVKDKKQPSWYSVAWLSCECYMYRRIVEALKQSKYHVSFDPFFEQKSKSFLTAENSMKSLASYALSILNTEDSNADGVLDSKEQLRLNFEMMLEYSLWGNKCDLSISAGRQVSNQLKDSGQLKNLMEHIISNDTQKIWNHLIELRSTQTASKRIDFILDNAGFELFSDLCFAEFLLEKQFCDVIYLHVKDLPWFISDTLRTDFLWTVQQCCNSPEPSIQGVGKRWQNRLNNNTFVIIQHQYWTLPHDFAAMKNTALDLYKMLSQSNLIIFKGDLNYRKLVGDRKWPHHSTFLEALHGFNPAPLCTLRTLKADLVVGLKLDQDKELTRKELDWMTSGQYAVVQFCDRKS